MKDSTAKWLIVGLLIVIIILLCACLYLDVRLNLKLPSIDNNTTTEKYNPTTTPKMTSTRVTTSTATPNSTSAVITTTTEPPVTTTTPVTTSTTNITTTNPPVTTTTPITTTAEVTTTLTTTTVAIVTTTTPVTTEKPYDPNAPTICIDPGHGFEDPGALGTLGGKTIYESTLNLEISLKLKATLEDMGYNVIMTHNGVDYPDDKYLTTSSPRFDVNMRNQWIYDRKDEIDLVISVHCNKYSTSQPSGSRYYILEKTDAYYAPNSYYLMSRLLASVKSAFSLSKEPTWNRETLAVLRTNIPSVLIECGFLSNTSDLTNLTNPAWQTKYATAIANGIASYCNDYVD